MSDISTFESRTGRAKCTAEELYYFLTDIRNFERFIPADKFTEISINRESCSFNVSMMGKVSVSLKDKKEFSEVLFSGFAMQVNEFSIAVRFSDADPGYSKLKLKVEAQLNPILKMLAAEPVNKFLEILICEIEKFDGWKDLKRDS